MKARSRDVIFWFPRGLGLVFAGFVSLFALDVLGAGFGFWETVLALIIHLVPTYAILIAVAIGWRWEWAGAVLFVSFGVSYLVMAWGDVDWIAFLVISGPSFLIGTLFLLDWLSPGGTRSST